MMREKKNIYCTCLAVFWKYEREREREGERSGGVGGLFHAEAVGAAT